jgi:hypothetical protein
MSLRGPSDLVNQIRREYFAANLLDPRSWVRKADDLRGAADLMRPELDRRWAVTRADPAWSHGGGNPPLGLNGVWLMLRALEIENLCKAHLVTSLSETEREEVETRGVLPRRLHSHGLLSLMQQTGLLLTGEEIGQLERLEDASVAFGRYPLPTRSDRVLSEENSARRSYDLNDVVDADSELTSAIARRVRDALPTNSTE